MKTALTSINNLSHFVTNRLVVLIILALLVPFGGLLAQTNPALEFNAGDGNPTGNGPVTNTTIQFRNNTNNPTGNTFATYNPAVAGPVTVQAQLTNQQYNFTGIPENGAVFFGYAVGSGVAIFPTHSGGYGVPANGDFTGSGAAVGQGIDVTSNRIISVYNLTAPLRVAGRSTSGRWQMADLVLTFSRPVNNPILHLQGWGGFVGSLAFTAEFDLQASNVPVTLSKLSGSTVLVTPTVGGVQQINNNAATPASSGTSSGKGSVLIEGDGITSVTFRVYIRGNGGGSNWANSTSASDGEAWGFSLSFLESDLAVTKIVAPTSQCVGQNVTFTVVATNNGPSNNTGVVVNDLLPSGYTYVGHTATNGNGTYIPGTGVWTIGNLNNGASQTLNITATVNASGNYTNVATISGDNSEPNLTNNTASATVTVHPQPSITITESDATCFGSSTGTIEITVSGGTGPFQFSINNGVDYTTPLPSPYTFTGLSAGTYNVQVRDANGCVAVCP